MLKITKKRIEDYRYNNNLPALADEWLQDVIDFDKVDKLQKLINNYLICSWTDLIDTLSLVENQEEIASQLDLNY